MSMKEKIGKENYKKCEKIIHTAAAASGGVGTGLAQIPLSDSSLIIPMQITMVVSLGAVFKRKVSESAAKAIINSAGAAFIGRGMSQIAFGWIPGIGNLINTATAAGLTEAIGWYAAMEFAKEDTEEDIEDEEFEKMRQAVSDAVENLKSTFGHKSDSDKNQADEKEDIDCVDEEDGPENVEDTVEVVDVVPEL